MTCHCILPQEASCIFVYIQEMDETVFMPLSLYILERPNLSRLVRLNHF